MFCCRVRYSLSESTVFLVGGYGIPCRRVRYSLSEGTVFLVGEYGITLQVHLRGIIAAFAGLLSKLLSEPGRSAPRRGANLWESTVFFVGEYGIDLSAGTVLGETWRGGRSCGRVRYRFVGEYGIRGKPGGEAVLVGEYGILRRRSPASQSDIYGKILGFYGTLRRKNRSSSSDDDGWSICRRVRYSLIQKVVTCWAPR
jgi:hypothetical protein